jgi:hypothetical protein
LNRSIGDGHSEGIGDGSSEHASIALGAERAERENQAEKQRGRSHKNENSIQRLELTSDRDF